jgi:hypothetical protein
MTSHDVACLALTSTREGEYLFLDGGEGERRSRPETTTASDVNMSRKNVEAKTVQKARKPSNRATNGYVHVAKPATASQIMRDLGISQARMKHLLQTLNFAGAQS